MGRKQKKKDHKMKLKSLSLDNQQKKMKKDLRKVLPVLLET
jgi:hypothetical protein